MWPSRPVVRDIQGVRMVLPWSHRLPDYTQGDSPYGQNLVELAKRLTGDGPIVVLDVGSNVGDSALQIAHAADAVVICVEADPYYLDFLHRNTGSDPRFEVEPSLLVPDAADAEATRRAVRIGGTTRFVEDAATPDSRPAVTPSQLRERHPRTAQLRLVKSDTDGYDVAIVTAVAREWADRRPVLFFEYDPAMTRAAGLDPLGVWSALAELGYREVAVWGNGGHQLGRTTVDEMPDATALLDGPRERYAPSYWDVAVAHESDVEGVSALVDLVPRHLDLTGR
jgi:FkbM family methyltransferase